MTRSRALLLAAVTALTALLLTACPSLTPAPSVTSFDASPTSIVAGASATLSWSVGGSATSVGIDHGVGDVTGLGKVTVTPATTTTYTLTAGNAGGSDSATATVTVTPAPPPVTLALDGSHGQVRVNGTAHALPYSHDFASGSTVALEAVPDGGYAFDHWSGDVTGSANPTSITPTADAAVTAVFVVAGSDAQPPSLNVVSPAAGASSSAATLTVQGTATDNVGVSSVQARIGSGSPVDCALALPDFTCSVGDLAASTNTLTVTARDAAGNQTGVTRTVAYVPPPSEPYNIALTFVSSISTTQQQAFQDAAARWEQVIAAGLPDVTNVTIPANTCGPNKDLPVSDITQPIDDVRIDVQVGTIDGVGGVLGFAGPCYIRNSDGLTLYGIMRFDSADLANLENQGALKDTILHEMGHVLGIGTLWGPLLSGAGTNNPRFIGYHAVDEWHALGGSAMVPVENCLDASGQPIQGCGTGTRDGHWREAVFGNELMTGYLDTPPNPLSRMTVGSLADLGYAVNYAAADSYALATAATPLAIASKTHLNIVLVKPVGSLP